MSDLFKDLYGENTVKPKANAVVKKPPEKTKVATKTVETAPSQRIEKIEEEDILSDVYNLTEEKDYEQELARHIIFGEILNNPRFKKRRF